MTAICRSGFIEITDMQLRSCGPHGRFCLGRCLRDYSVRTLSQREQERDPRLDNAGYVGAWWIHHVKSVRLIATHAMKRRRADTTHWFLK